MLKPIETWTHCKCQWIQQQAMCFRQDVSPTVCIVVQRDRMSEHRLPMEANCWGPMEVCWVREQFASKRLLVQAMRPRGHVYTEVSNHDCWSNTSTKCSRMEGGACDSAMPGKMNMLSMILDHTSQQMSCYNDEHHRHVKVSLCPQSWCSMKRIYTLQWTSYYMYETYRHVTWYLF